MIPTGSCHGCPVGPVVAGADGIDEAPHPLDREHVGEPLVPADLEFLERRPVAGCGVRVEELDAAVGDGQRCGGKLSLVLEVEEVVADLLFGEAVGRCAEVVGELPDGAKVSLLGALAERGKLEVLVHPLAECRGRAECHVHRKVLSQRSKETPLQGTHCHGMATCQGLSDRREPP
jgi:hypothetical protein